MRREAIGPSFNIFIFRFPCCPRGEDHPREAVRPHEVHSYQGTEELLRQDEGVVRSQRRKCKAAGLPWRHSLQQGLWHSVNCLNDINVLPVKAHSDEHCFPLGAAVDSCVSAGEIGNFLIVHSNCLPQLYATNAALVNQPFGIWKTYVVKANNSLIVSRRIMKKSKLKLGRFRTLQMALAT